MNFSKIFLNCTSIQNTIPSASGSAADYTCSCKSPYFWDQLSERCIVDCSSLQQATRNAQQECQCQKKGFYHYFIYMQMPSWFRVDSGNQKLCSYNCASVKHSLGSTTSLPQCQCLQPHNWNSTLLLCQLNRSLIVNSDASIPVTTNNSCTCMDRCAWNEQSLACMSSSRVLMVAAVSAGCAWRCSCRCWSGGSAAGVVQQGMNSMDSGVRLEKPFY